MRNLKFIKNKKCYIYILHLFLNTIFLLSLSCNFSNNRRRDYNIEARKIEAGKPSLIKEKVPEDTYKKAIDKGINLLNETIQIPKGIKDSDLLTKHKNDRDKLKGNIEELKNLDSSKKNQEIIKNGGIILQKFWLIDVPNSITKSYSNASYDKNFKLNTHLKSIVENDAKWKSFVNKHLRYIPDLLIQKEKAVFKDKSIVFKDENIRKAISKCINTQEEVSKSYFDLALKNKDTFVKLIFKKDPKKNYFINLVNYTTNKVGDLLDNLSTFGDLKTRLISKTNEYIKIDPDGKAAYALGHFLDETKKDVFDKLKEAIEDVNNKGIINNMNGLYNLLNKMGYGYMRFRMKTKEGILLKIDEISKIKKEKINAIVEVFRVYIDILKRLLNKFKGEISTFLNEFVGKIKSKL